MVRSYLYSDGFRKVLSETVSRNANVDGHFSPFRWDGLAVNSDNFEAAGKGLVRELRVDGLHTEIGLNGIRRGVWEIRGITRAEAGNFAGCHRTGHLEGTTGEGEIHRFTRETKRLAADRSRFAGRP